MCGDLINYNVDASTYKNILKLHVKYIRLVRKYKSLLHGLKIGDFINIPIVLMQ